MKTLLVLCELTVPCIAAAEDDASEDRFGSASVDLLGDELVELEGEGGNGDGVDDLEHLDNL